MGNNLTLSLLQSPISSARPRLTVRFRFNLGVLLLARLTPNDTVTACCLCLQ